MLNLTQHVTTPEQISAGVVEPLAALKGKIQRLLTFTTLPSAADIGFRAGALAEIAATQEGAGGSAMVGGAPYLMAPLCLALRIRGIVPYFSFTERVSSEEVVGGKVIKTSAFKHVRFVEALLESERTCPNCNCDE